MNDLAEKALQGLNVARRGVVGHPMLTFGALGLVIASGVVVAGGQVNSVRATRPLNSWLGLQDTHTAQASDWVAGAIMLAALALLVLLWLAVVAFVRRHDQPDARVWWVAAACGLPFALGPPLMGTSVQTYAAYGLLQRHALSPYDYGPSRLGSDHIVTAIEPGARGTPSAAGPLGSLLQHLSVSVATGSTTGAIIVLRAVGVIAAVAIGRLAADLSGAFPCRALTLTVLNPLLLLYVVSAARLDGVMLALVLAALSAANQRRWLVSVALICLAGCVLAEAFVVLPAILAVHWLGRRTIPTWLLLGRDLLVAAGTTVAAGFIVRDGFGWLWTVTKQFSAHTPYSITGAIAKLLSPIVRGASYDDLAAGARITAVTAMVCVIAFLIGTARQRSLERTAGYCLLALGLLSPVLYPWYLLWGTMCLAASANGARLTAVLALCAAGCMLDPQGFTPTTTNVITGIALGVVALVMISLPALRRDSRERQSATAGT
ncbi:MAG TPA: polyprenol phosphomannose-dependent alpha 1,6 mannosyltransferase MptB [Jatrophihabitans sp.]|jgi:hypothetical protein|nr:polyprenol phosphomannose-dependent alpha 1,6 mannosyltransferase MptB [Jatrophihabitans sp.]